MQLETEARAVLVVQGALCFQNYCAAGCGPRGVWVVVVVGGGGRWWGCGRVDSASASTSTRVPSEVRRDDPWSGGCSLFGMNALLACWAR